MAEALRRYQKEIVPEKRHPYQEERRIGRWLDHDLAYRTLANLRGADFARYRDARRAEGRAENTIRLELQVIRHLFEIARKEWGMEGLSNPLDNIRKPSGSKAWDRRLRPGEFERLKALLTASRNPWASPAFELAIETSLRQCALFSLRWEWVDLKSRVVRVPVEARGADNKGVPAVLPLSMRAVGVLRHLASISEGGDARFARAVDGPPDVRYDLQGPVFATSVNTVICVWKGTLQAAGKGDPAFLTLRWHDLRHEAASGFLRRDSTPWRSRPLLGIAACKC